MLRKIYIEKMNSCRQSTNPKVTLVSLVVMCTEIDSESEEGTENEDMGKKERLYYIY